METLDGYMAQIVSSDAVLFAIALAIMYPIINNLASIKNSIVDVFTVLFCTRVSVSSIKSPANYDALQKIVFDCLKKRNSISYRNEKRVPYPKSYYLFFLKRFTRISLKEETLNSGVIDHVIDIMIFFTRSKSCVDKIQYEIENAQTEYTTEPGCYIVEAYDSEGYFDLSNLHVKAEYDVSLFNQKNLNILEGLAANMLSEKTVTASSVVLSGVSGTGKTTIVKHLSVKYGIPIYFFPLSVKKKNLLGVVDRVFSNVLGKQNVNGIVLIEECDRLLNDDTTPLFLNTLDGIVQIQNKLIVLTTNFPEKLDERLLRKGRAQVLTFTKEDIIK